MTRKVPAQARVRKTAFAAASRDGVVEEQQMADAGGDVVAVDPAADGWDDAGKESTYQQRHF